MGDVPSHLPVVLDTFSGEGEAYGIEPILGVEGGGRFDWGFGVQVGGSPNGVASEF